MPHLQYSASVLDSASSASDSLAIALYPSATTNTYASARGSIPLRSFLCPVSPDSATGTHNFCGV